LLTRDFWPLDMITVISAFNTKMLLFFIQQRFLSLVGHGQSGGDRVIVENVEYMVQDAVSHIKVMQGHYPGVPTFLVGHSMVQFY
jgi:hypothetical protein